MRTFLNIVGFLGVAGFLAGVPLEALSYEGAVSLTTVRIRDRGEDAPIEPKIPAVKFLKIEPARNTKERVDSLLHGVYTDIPPEYDHYGYEIRRYMSHTLSPEVLGNPEKIKQELENISKVRIIYSYWQKDIFQKISDIEKELEADPYGTSGLRSTFKYNRSIVEAFSMKCRTWIDSNEKFLKFLQSKQGAFGFRDPEFLFDIQDDRDEAIALLEEHVKALDDIRTYIPFSIMVY